MEIDSGWILGLRSSLKLSQGEFGRILGVSQPRVSAWENHGYLPNQATQRLMRLLQADTAVVQTLRVLSEQDKENKPCSR